MGANEAKTRQLGMPIGTAANRLRKMVLFDVLQRHGENMCVRCGAGIESVDDLSIEHLKSWLYGDTALFWSMDNIAFSHLSCNAGHPRSSMTHCKRGHEFNAENTYQSDGRRCRICGDSYRSRREASLTVGTTLEA